MVEMQFYPLDITYRIINNIPVVYLYGRTIDNQQVAVMDDSFRPYFYVILKKDKDLSSFSKQVSKIRIEKDEHVSQITKIEIEKKNYFGQLVQALKIFTNFPQDVPILGRELRHLDAVEHVLETDIHFVRRYLVDKNITPLVLTLANAEPTRQRSKVPVFKLDKIEQLEGTYTNPSILAFDIETYSTSEQKIVDMEQPIIMIGFYSKNFQKVITWKRFKTELDYIEFVNSEAELLNRFKEIIETIRPDILVGYNSDGFDFPYIIARAGKYKIDIDLGFDYSVAKLKRGSISAVQITGLVHLDLYRFIRIIATTLKTDSYSLNNVAYELIGSKKREIKIEDLHKVWDENPNELGKFCEYNLTDTTLTYNLCEKLLPSLIELVKIIGLPLYDVNRMSYSQLDEWYLIKQSPNFNELIPVKPSYSEIRSRRGYTYVGAQVFEPKPGLYKNIVVLDFKGFWPSILVSHNISPSTLCCDCCKDVSKHIQINKRDCWFCVKKKGFIPSVTKDLLTRRMRIKEIMKDKFDPLLHARQYALKTLANSMYGYLGFFGARWYSIYCGASITYIGKEYIEMVTNKSKEQGYDVLYSDTDSIFLALKNKSVEDSKRFAETINKDLPELMELEFEDFYPAGIFVSVKEGTHGAKKRYALLDSAGKIKITGFETVRRNVSVIAREVQENIFRFILKEGDTKGALKYVQGIINDLRNKTVPLDKVIISTQMQKNIEDYESIGPHVAAAKRLKAMGAVVGPGSLIRFVIARGKEKIRDRVKLPNECKQEDYDADYYINNQVIPAVEKIFEVIGYSKEDLIEEKTQKKLGAFL